MTHNPPPTPEIPCSACGYDLRHAPEDTCPECGSSPPRRKAVARRRAGLRRFFIILILAPLLGPVIAFIGLYLWFMPPNIGLPFGYYGNYNRVHRHIQALPNVTIEEVWLHRDTTLEDFGFVLTVDGRWHVDFEVSGGHDCRNDTQFWINRERFAFDESPLADLDQGPSTVAEVLAQLSRLMEDLDVPDRPRDLWSLEDWPPPPRLFLFVEPAE